MLKIIYPSMIGFLEYCLDIKIKSNMIQLIGIMIIVVTGILMGGGG